MVHLCFVTAHKQLADSKNVFALSFYTIFYNKGSGGGGGGALHFIYGPTFQQYFIAGMTFVLSQPGERSVQSTREANPVGENNSFIFTVCQICSTLSF